MSITHQADAIQLCRCHQLPCTHHRSLTSRSLCLNVPTIFLNSTSALKTALPALTRTHSGGPAAHQCQRTHSTILHECSHQSRAIPRESHPLMHIVSGYSTYAQHSCLNCQAPMLDTGSIPCQQQPLTLCHLCCICARACMHAMHAHQTQRPQLSMHSTRPTPHCPSPSTQMCPWLLAASSACPSPFHLSAVTKCPLLSPSRASTGLRLYRSSGADMGL